jgi:hypothetical protein
MGLGQSEEALKQFEAVVAMEPLNKQALGMVSTCREDIHYTLYSYTILTHYL